MRILPGDSPLSVSMTICPKHRAELGLNFWPSKICCYPDHKGRKGKRSHIKGSRPVSLNMSKEMKVVKDTSVPVGSGKIASKNPVKPYYPNPFKKF